MDYTIQPGDTLGAIASRFGITLSQLLAANPQIIDPNLIFVGQHITIPGTLPVPSPGTVYIVRPGDTLSRIAASFGITLSQLLAANPEITNPNSIFVGQQINIPNVAPPGTALYTIQPGDTLFAIARRLGTTVNTLLSLNPGINPNQLIPGQQIRIPAVTPLTPPGCLVYVSTRSGQPELWRSDAAGNGAVQITRGSGTAAQPVSNPLWSPNGRFIAYQAVGGLFIIDPCGRRPLRLAANVVNYSWANDSSRLAYSNSEGTFIVTLEGQSTKVASDFNNPVWFPGDTRLAGSASATEEIRFPHLATVESSGANYTVIEPLVPGNIILVSPDGRYALTQTFQGFAYGVFSLLNIYDFSSGTKIILPGLEIPVNPDVVRNINFLGGWSPDSKQLIYSTITALNGQGELRVASPQGNILQRFSRSFYPIPKWGPSNDWVVYTLSGQAGTEAFTPTTPRNIYILNIRTNQEMKITTSGDNYSPDWNPISCLPC